MGLKEELEKLKNFINRVSVDKTETYNIDITRDPRFLEKIPQAIMQENAQLKAEKARLMQQLAEINAAKKAEEHELLVKQEIIKRQLQLNQQKKEKSISLYFKIKDLKNCPTFFYKSNKTMFGAKLVGIQLQDAEDGKTLYYPLLLKEGQKKPMKLKYPVINIEEWWKNKTGVVSQLHAGRADTNFEMSKKGELMLLNPDVYDDTKTGQKVEIIRMDEAEKQEYEERIHRTEQRMNGYIHELKKQLKIADELQQKNDDNEIENAATKQQRDAFAARFATMVEKSTDLVKSALNAQVGLQDAVQSQVLTEKEAAQLIDRLEEANLKIQQYQSGGSDEVAAEKA
ncbi:MAG: hypothetical protein AAB875_00395, partial [Patescibacteria group bacterium]